MRDGAINVGTSGGERMAAMLGGQCDILAANYMQVKDYIAKGDLVLLGVMSKARENRFGKIFAFKQRRYKAVFSFTIPPRLIFRITALFFMSENV